MRLATKTTQTIPQMPTPSEPPAFTTDRFDRIVYWNGAAEELVGLSAQEARGRNLSAVLSRDDVAGRFEVSLLRIPGERGETRVYVLDPRARSSYADDRMSCPLSDRELGILDLLSNGYAALNIAARLNLSHSTVRNHIHNVLRKLNVHGQVEAVSLALREGWIPVKPRVNTAPPRPTHLSVAS